LLSTGAVPVESGYAPGVDTGFPSGRLQSRVGTSQNLDGALICWPAFGGPVARGARLRWLVGLGSGGWRCREAAGGGGGWPV